MHYKTALITGASSGLGEELAVGLAKQGTQVVLCARRQAELERVAGRVRDAGGLARTQVLDVADAEATVEALRRIDADPAVGGLDLIIANAGVGEVMSGRKLTWERVAPMCHVNFTGAIATLTAVLPQMVSRGRGHLVGVSSLAAYGPAPRNAAYSATKAGLSRFLEGLHLDLAGTGVRVTCVQPGFIKTPMTEKNRFPMPFLIDAEAAAGIVLRRLPAAPAVLDFPLPTAVAARAAGTLPRLVREALARRIPVG